EYGFPCQADWRTHQRACALDFAAFEPQRLPVSHESVVEEKLSPGEALARAGAAEAHDLPAEVARRAGQPHFTFEQRERTVENDGLARQPFERAGDVEAELLPRPWPGRAIPLARPGRGQDGRGVRARLHVQPQVIAAGDTSRRVDHDGVAYLLAFRVQRLLNHERPFSGALREHGSPAFSSKFKLEMRTPGPRQRCGAHARSGS